MSELHGRKLKIAISVENGAISKQTVHTPSFHISTDSAEPQQNRSGHVSYQLPTHPHDAISKC